MSALDDLRGHLARAYPHEGVGAISAGAGTLRFWPLENRSETPRERFHVDTLAFLALQQRVRADGAQLTALCHSHPDGSAQLSPIDLAALLPGGIPLYPDLVQIVAGVRRTGVESLAAFVYDRKQKRYCRSESALDVIRR